MLARTQNIRRIIEQRFDGNKSEFARAALVAPAQISQWLSGYRNIGEKAARKIEEALGMASGALDIDADNPSSPSHQRQEIPPVQSATVPQTIDQMLEIITQMAQQIKELQQQTSGVIHMEHAWPFKDITRDQWLDLTKEQKAIVESVAAGMLTAHHSAGGGGQHDKRQAA